MIELLDYHPYGTGRISWSSSSTDGSAESQKTYIGEYSDNESGLSYLNARYYDPVRGQFLGQDPTYLVIGNRAELESITGIPQEVVLSDPQLLNAYAYAKNNPLRYKDPEGKFLDAILDVGFTLYSGFKLGVAIITGGDVKGEAVNFALDAGGLFIPGVAGLGTIKRTANAVDNVADVTKGVMRQAPIENVSPYDLTPTHGIYKSEKEMEALTDSIRNDGIQTPIKYVENNSQKYIVDGHHRNKAAKDAGLQQVPVQKVELPYNGYSSSTDLNNWDR